MRKTLKQFIRLNRAGIDKAIRRAAPNAGIDDSTRRQWVVNDSALNKWARSEGVKI